MLCNLCVPNYIYFKYLLVNCYCKLLLKIYSGETISTLKFANRAKNIRNEAKINEDLDQKSLLRKYEQELKLLRAQLEERSQNVVDRRKLLEVDELRRRAEADKIAAIRALELRSLEFIAAKEDKKRLEERISTLMGQMIRGDSNTSNHEISVDDSLNVENQDSKSTDIVNALTLREEYRDKLAELEREKEDIESERAQAERFKQLLLKQRDIMLSLTARLVEVQFL